MTIDAFNPVGKTYTVNAVTNPSEATQIVVGLQTPQYRVLHPGTELVWLGYGKTAEEAVAAASPKTVGVPLMPGTDEVLSFDGYFFFAAYCEKATQTILITPGYGL
jgi:hypothetical protein